MQYISLGKKGLSLGNVIVGVTVFLIIITAVFSLTFTAFRGALQVKERIEAIFLAREGLEIIRNIRDTSTFQFKKFLESSAYGDDIALYPTGKFIVGMNMMENKNFSWKVQRIINADDERSYFRLYSSPQGILTLPDAGGVDASSFYRFIIVQFLSIDPSTKEFLPAKEHTDIAKVTSEVMWRNYQGSWKNYTATTILTNTSNL